MMAMVLRLARCLWRVEFVQALAGRQALAATVSTSQFVPAQAAAARIERAQALPRSVSVAALSLASSSASGQAVMVRDAV